MIYRCKIENNTVMNKRRNKTYRERLNIKPVINIIKEHRLGSYELVKRMSENMIAKPMKKREVGIHPENYGMR